MKIKKVFSEIIFFEVIFLLKSGLWAASPCIVRRIYILRFDIFPCLWLHWPYVPGGVSIREFSPWSLSWVIWTWRRLLMLFFVLFHCSWAVDLPCDIYGFVLALVFWWLLQGLYFVRAYNPCNTATDNCIRRKRSYITISFVQSNRFEKNVFCCDMAKQVCGS